jgi:branched-chain amino acid aminotransferase
MVETQKMNIQRIEKSRLDLVDFNDLPFGKVFADHMFLADYRDGEWKNLRIMPYGYLPMSPATPAIHYGQSIFEGMKAFAGSKNEALIFRPLANWKRLNESAERMCMPSVPEEIFMEGILSLIELDRKWIPNLPGSSLYIRPFMFSADEYIGIRPSQNFTFMVINCPVGPYYATPVKVRIETHYSRAIEGGTGFAKAGGNYGGALYPSKLALDQGYHQLIWTDGKTHQYVEESGTMNVMFVIDNTLVTPALGDTILKGITRDSVLTLARHWGMKVEERKLSVSELVEGLKSGRVKEAFGAGTAATIAHIELIGHEGRDYVLPPIEQREFSNRVFKELEGIKRGTHPDPFGWMMRA